MCAKDKCVFILTILFNFIHSQMLNEASPLRAERQSVNPIHFPTCPNGFFFSLCARSSQWPGNIFIMSISEYRWYVHRPKPKSKMTQNAHSKTEIHNSNLNLKRLNKLTIKERRKKVEIWNARSEDCTRREKIEKILLLSMFERLINEWQRKSEEHFTWDYVILLPTTSMDPSSYADNVKCEWFWGLLCWIPCVDWKF